MNKSLLIASAIAASLALPAAAQAEQPTGAVGKSEKCYGIAAPGQNDCQTATHSCAGEAKKDRDPADWMYLPVGTCKRISGGSLTRKG